MNMENDFCDAELYNGESLIVSNNEQNEGAVEEEEEK